MTNLKNNKKLSLYYYDNCFFCTKVIDYIEKHNITNIELKNTNKSINHKDLVKYGGYYQVPCLRIKLATKDKWLYESDDIIKYLD